MLASVFWSIPPLRHYGQCHCPNWWRQFKNWSGNLSSWPRTSLFVSTFSHIWSWAVKLSAWFRAGGSDSCRHFPLKAAPLRDEGSQLNIAFIAGSLCIYFVCVCIFIHLARINYLQCVKLISQHTWRKAPPRGNEEMVSFPGGLRRWLLSEVFVTQAGDF